MVITRKSLSFHQIAYGALVCGLFAATPSPSGDNSGNAAARLDRIMTVIDSLEVEKQTAKRSGGSLAELENITARLRDTASFLRNELQARKTDAGSAKLIGGAPDQKSLPSALCLIDKVVIGAGAATLVFALIFLFFFLSASAQRRKASAHKHPPIKPFEPRRDATRGEDSAARRAYAAQIKAIAEQEALLDKSKSPTPQSAAPSLKPGEIPVQRSSPDAQIIKAFDEGQDIKTISRRFHIGVDQVALILKMAKKK